MPSAISRYSSHDSRRPAARPCASSPAIVRSTARAKREANSRLPVAAAMRYADDSRWSPSTSAGHSRKIPACTRISAAIDCICLGATNYYSAHSQNYAIAEDCTAVLTLADQTLVMVISP